MKGLLQLWLVLSVAILLLFPLPAFLARMNVRHDLAADCDSGIGDEAFCSNVYASLSSENDFAYALQTAELPAKVVTSLIVSAFLALVMHGFWKAIRWRRPRPSSD